MKKQRSGISLIVLVITIIVIIILAVAVILSIANNNPIENAKEARIKNDLKTIEEELTLKQASNYVEEHANNKTPGKISIDDLESATNYKDKLGITEDGKLFVTGNASEEERKVAKGLGIETKDPITFTKQGELAIGSEVTASNGEQFYVIGGAEVGEAITSDTKNIILLTKYNLKKENEEVTLKQDTSETFNECAFCSSDAWNNANVVVGDDLNNKVSILSDTTSAVSKAKAYGKVFGVTGRLMTYKEATNLANVNSAILYGNSQENYTCLNYWLSSASDELENNCVWFVWGEQDQMHGDYYYESQYGVRPVIVVSASLIQ